MLFLLLCSGTIDLTFPELSVDVSFKPSVSGVILMDKKEEVDRWMGG